MNKYLRSRMLYAESCSDTFLHNALRTEFKIFALLVAAAHHSVEYHLLTPGILLQLNATCRVVVMRIRPARDIATNLNFISP